MTHTNTTNPPFATLMDDPTVGTLDDARMILAYLQSGRSPAPLPMAIGDPYLLGATLPRGLAAYERKAPAYLGGYSRTPAGIPEARRLIAAATIRRQGLRSERLGKDFDMHITSGTGTRGIIGDFGRYVLDQQAGDERTPVALCAAPTWDYAGVLEPMGYKMAFWPLRAERGWLPDAEDIKRTLAAVDADPDRRVSLVIVNTQHNPSGSSWTAETLRYLYEAAISRGAGILLDDPYNAVVTDTAKPVSAPAVLFDYLAASAVPSAASRLWCRVESFGKAFTCNDWGIGSIMAHPETLASLANYTFRWAFPRAGKRQWAMAQWLTDPASERYLARQRAALRRKRKAWAQLLLDHGWPAELTAVGEATPYFLMAVPPRYLAQTEGISRARQEIMDATGILLSYASIEQEGTEADMPFLRAYLGGTEAVVAEAIRRFKKAAIRYE